MVKRYTIQTKLTKKQINAYRKSKTFTHKHSIENDDKNEIYEIDFANLKSLHKLMGMGEKGKGARFKPSDILDIKVHQGGSIWGSISRGFKDMGNKVKDTFSEGNMKTAVKVVVPSVVGGLTAATVAPIVTGATGVNPVFGVVAGSAAGGVTSKLTSDALNKSLGSGLKRRGRPKKGSGIVDSMIPIAYEGMKQIAPLVGTALIGYAANKVKNAFSSNKHVQEAKAAYDQGNEYKRTYTRKAKQLENDYNNLTTQYGSNNTANQYGSTNSKYQRRQYSGNGVSGYRKGSGIVGYGRGLESIESHNRLVGLEQSKEPDYDPALVSRKEKMAYVRSFRNK